MPLTPDFVIELVLPLCPPEPVLRTIAELVDENAPALDRPSERDGEPIERTSLAVCRSRPEVSGFVLSVGIWGNAFGFGEAVLQEALLAMNLMIPGLTAALMISARAIQVRADLDWAEARRKFLNEDEEIDLPIGSATLREEIDVRIGSDGMSTKVRGTWRIPLVPDVDFTISIRDQLSLEAPGSDPPLHAKSSRDVDSDLPDVVIDALIAGILRPFFGGLVFFGIEPLIESQVPADTASAGEKLAHQWLTHFLTPIVNPFSPTGKIAFTWTGLTVDDRGVLTHGITTSAVRSPRVAILGLRTVRILEAIGQFTASFRADTRDLRDPQFVWSGSAGATGAGSTTDITFVAEGQFEVTVAVSDADGFSAMDTILVAVSFFALEPEPEPEPGPTLPVELDFKPTVLTFGSVPVGSSSTRTFTIGNQTGATVDISLAAPSSGSVFQWEAFSGTLANGEERVVEVTFRPTSNAISNGTLTVMTSTPAGSRSIGLIGKGPGGFPTPQ